ncbi:SAM-dependent methyltransferase, partial [Mesorhizobium sp. M7A.F.Ca.CA.001.07.2.1]
IWLVQDRAPDDTATAISGDVWFSSEDLHPGPRK